MQRRVAKCHPFCMERKVMNQITYGLVRGSTNKQDVSHKIQKIKENIKVGIVKNIFQFDTLRRWNLMFWIISKLLNKSNL